MKQLERKIQNQKKREKILTNKIGEDLELAFTQVRVTTNDLMFGDTNQTIVRNTLANELDIVYNEMVDEYPEYVEDIESLVPSNYHDSSITRRKFIHMAIAIQLLRFILSFLERMFSEVSFDGFDLVKDNEVLGMRLIDRLVKNCIAVQYMLVSKIMDIITTGVIVKDAFKVSNQVVYWFGLIVTDFMTYFSRYEELWSLKKQGITEYQFYTSADERVCDECGVLHEEVFSVDKAIVGVNFPPIHNRCRCWIVGLE